MTRPAPQTETATATATATADPVIEPPRTFHTTVTRLLEASRRSALWTPDSLPRS